MTEQQTAIVQYKQSALSAPDCLSYVYSYPPLLASIGRNFPGDLRDSERTMKTKAIIEQAIVHIANSPDFAKRKLLACTVESVVQSIGDCAALDLSLNRATGEAALVPYSNACTLMPMYRGFVKLMMRTGKVDSIQAECVYKGESFKISGGTSPNIDHEIRIDVDRDDKNIIGVYCIVHHKSGPPSWSVMNRKEIDGIKAKSAAGEKGPWGYYYGEMAKKSVIRRARKTVDMSADDIASRQLLAAEELDNRDYGPAAEAAKTGLIEHGKELRQKALAPLPATEAPGQRTADDDPPPEAQQ